MIQEAIGALLKEKIGLNPLSIGYSTIARAIRQRMATCGLVDTNIYLTRLQTSARELEELIETVIVPETWFFRDREPFVLLSRYALAEWLPAHPNGILRVLSVPCATGEEPYSIAIALLKAGLSPKNICIDAVDISKKSLLKAQQALYSQNSFRGNTSVLPHLASTLKDSRSGYSFRERYFTRKGEQYQLHDWVKSTVNFIHGNLLDPYFLIGKRPYDAIFCRNLLIYFDPSAKQQTLRVLQRLLTNNGLLFVGHSETGQFLNSQFVPVQHPFAFAYRKMEERDQEPGVRSQGSGVRGQGAGSRGEEFSPQPPAPILPASSSPAPPLPAPLPLREWQPLRGVEMPVANQPSKLPLEIQNSQTLILETAQKLADRGQLDEAATLCETYLSENRTSVEAYVLLGRVHQARGNAEQAEQSFHKAIYLEPNCYEALIHLALLKEHRGDLKSAALIWQRIQRLPTFHNS